MTSIDVKFDFLSMIVVEEYDLTGTPPLPPNYVVTDCIC